MDDPTLNACQDATKWLKPAKNEKESTVMVSLLESLNQIFMKLQPCVIFQVPF